MKRWKVVLWYRSNGGTVDVEHEIEEVAELHGIIERGPHWDCLIRAEIRPARPFYRELTVEQAEAL